MSDHPVRGALVAALAAPRRHLAAVALVAAAFGIAAVVGSSTAYYGASLVAFAVWMGWFVLTGVELLRRVDF